MAIQHVTYFILAREASKVKIGQCRETNPPVKRLKALQTGSPEYLEVLLLLPHKPPFEEIQMHRRFSQYRIQGEWFDYRGELKSFIESKIQDPTPTVEDDPARSIGACNPRQNQTSLSLEVIEIKRVINYMSNIARESVVLQPHMKSG